MKNLPESPQIVSASEPHPKGCRCALCLGALRSLPPIVGLGTPLEDPQLRAALVRGVILGTDTLRASLYSGVTVHTGLDAEATRFTHRTLEALLQDGRFGRVLGSGELIFYVTPFFLVRDVLNALTNSREILLA